MFRNNPINSVYLIALACASLVFCVDSFYSALVFGVVIVGVFLVSISLVSMIEKIADKHVKFLAFALISAALITIFKVVFEFVNIKMIVLLADTIDMAIIPCLLIGIIPIYYEESFSVKQFFITALTMSVGTLLMILIFGALIEVIGFGAFAGIELGFAGVEFFTLPHGAFMLIATLCILFNIVRRGYIKRQRRYEMLVERYKIQIREIRTSDQRKKESEGGKQ